VTDPHARVLATCQRHLPAWRDLSVDDVSFTGPGGFSSFTVAVRCRRPGVQPRGVFFRRLRGKENAILDFEAERQVFLALGEAGIAARCVAYERDYRLEALYEGRSLTAQDLRDAEVLRGIAGELHRFHGLRPAGLPGDTFFERLHRRWGALARRVLEEQLGAFPDHERALCEPLRAIYADATRRMVERCVPDAAPVFCHNDTYHGNVFELASGRIKMLDFEFSCLGQRAFDFANLFAETTMRHGLAEPPHFALAEPDFGEAEIAQLVGYYLDCEPDLGADERAERHANLVRETLELVPLSDYMYALAAIPLAVAPIQRIRFIPYASQRFDRFQRAYEQRFAG
jgi:thiamine kinase-like enzyme